MVLLTQDEMIVDLFKQISRDPNYSRLCFQKKIALIYDWVNYYDDGSRVVDIHGNHLPRISHGTIKNVIRSSIDDTLATEVAILHQLQSAGVTGVYPMIL